jgi:hypothetical protein
MIAGGKNRVVLVTCGTLTEARRIESGGIGLSLEE